MIIVIAVCTIRGEGSRDETRGAPRTGRHERGHADFENEAKGCEAERSTDRTSGRNIARRTVMFFSTVAVKAEPCGTASAGV